MSTIADVAKRAGVSLSTVSYVLSGRRPISQATTDRVMQAVRELDFAPHAGAKSMRNRKTGVIAIVVPLIYGQHSQVQMPFIAAALEAARDHDLDVLLLTANDGLGRVETMVNSSMVDGVVVMEIQRDDPRIAKLSHLKRPVVLLGTPDDARAMPTVDFDFFAAGELLANYLADEGHQVTAFLGQSPAIFEKRIGFAVAAREGFGAAARSRSMTVITRPLTPTPLAVQTALSDLLRVHPGITAISVFNEQALPLVVDYFESRSPATAMTLTAIAPNDLLSRLPRPIAAVHLPAEELAILAVNTLASAMAGENLPALNLLEPSLVFHVAAGEA